MAKRPGNVSQIPDTFHRLLRKRRLFYVCRDAERAEAGDTWGLNNYRILTNVSNKSALDTDELLRGERARELIRRGDYVMVFKPTRVIEKLCAERGWKLLNPPAALAARVEEKISQVEWLKSLAKYLPPYKIRILNKINFSSHPFILQFNHGHTGSGTYLIKNATALLNLQKKFPQRPARVTKYINGPVFTLNIVVWGEKILPSNISYQITGRSPFTKQPFATVGNDWSLPDKILSPAQRKRIITIANAVGKKMSHDGWRGLFGIDVIMDEKSKQIYLIEINARQPASASCESLWQEVEHTPDNTNITVFTAHTLALLNVPYQGEKLLTIKQGAQIVWRNKEKTPKINHSSLSDLRLVIYPHTQASGERLRLQSPSGIMLSHNKFNNTGNRIVQALTR